MEPKTMAIMGTGGTVVLAGGGYAAYSSSKTVSDNTNSNWTKDGGAQYTVTLSADGQSCSTTWKYSGSSSSWSVTTGKEPDAIEKFKKQREESEKNHQERIKEAEMACEVAKREWQEKNSRK